MSKLKSILKYALSAVLWISVWYIAAIAIGKPLLFPTPLKVAVRIAELCTEAEFWKICAFSLLRVVAGMLTGVILALLTALLTSFVPLTRTLIHPLITVIKATPVASFVILVLLFVGRELLPVVITFMIVFPVVWTNLDEGFRNTDKKLLEMSRLYRFGKLKRMRFIYIPSIAPYFFSASRASMGLAWKAGIAAEVIAVPAVSIGRMLFDAKINIEAVDMFAWTTVVIILSLVIEFVFMASVKKYSGGKRNDKN